MECYSKRELREYLDYRNHYAAEIKCLESRLSALDDDLSTVKADLQEALAMKRSAGEVEGLRDRITALEVCRSETLEQIETTRAALDTAEKRDFNIRG